MIFLDELGYIFFDKVGLEILFNLSSNRNDKGSIIINSSLIFDRWNEVFNDTMLTGALVERLDHRVHILDVSLEKSSYYEDTIVWLIIQEYVAHFQLIDCIKFRLTIPFKKIANFHLHLILAVNNLEVQGI